MYDAMLAESAGDPDEILGVLPPRFGQATRRLIAINGVLAGCAPEVMPVLVTAVRALTHSELNLRGVNATTHPVAPLLIVHGDLDTNVPPSEADLLGQIAETRKKAGPVAVVHVPDVNQTVSDPKPRAISDKLLTAIGEWIHKL